MRRRRLETGITRPLGVAGLLKRAVAMVHRQRRIAVPVTPRLRIGLVFGGLIGGAGGRRHGAIYLSLAVAAIVAGGGGWRLFSRCPAQAYG